MTQSQVKNKTKMKLEQRQVAFSAMFFITTHTNKYTLSYQCIRGKLLQVLTTYFAFDLSMCIIYTHTLNTFISKAINK